MIICNTKYNKLWTIRKNEKKNVQVYKENKKKRVVKDFDEVPKKLYSLNSSKICIAFLINNMNLCKWFNFSIEFFNFKTILIDMQCNVHVLMKSHSFVIKIADRSLTSTENNSKMVWWYFLMISSKLFYVFCKDVLFFFVFFLLIFIWKHKI